MEEIFSSLKKYNFWDGHVPKLGYLRSHYLDNIFKYCNNSLVKVLVGQRRTGKSYLLRQIAQKLIDSGVPAKNIFYINKEFIEFDEIRDYKDLELLIKQYQTTLNPKGKIYLFIDEVQNIVQWERLVNSYAQNYTEHFEVFISGSNSKMLSGELATFLSGRYINFVIYPFSYSEFIGINQFELNKQSYINYLQSGGLPELFSLPDQETKNHYVAAVKDTVLLRDIIQRHSIKEPKLLEDLFVYLVNTSSNLMSVNNVTNYFKSNGRKITYDTVANYIGYIEDTFLIHKVERFDIKGKDTIAGNVKYYCNDLAFKNYLFSGFGYGVGYQLENLIYLELCRWGFVVYVGVMPNKEVDFVAKKADRVLYIQSAYVLVDEATINREYASLEAIQDHYEKIVVSLDDVTFPIKNGIKHIQAWRLYEVLREGQSWKAR
jgi:predicted AAA+ superfamily ATPase